MTQKTLKIDQKSLNIYDIKIGWNLTTKRGDSGSAVMLEEKCVIIEAPKTDTIIDQNSSLTEKSDKNDQNQKMQKMRKVRKCKKWQNQKIRKV